jgi:endonuclease YncB( thermonuclease family)
MAPYTITLAPSLASSVDRAGWRGAVAGYAEVRSHKVLTPVVSGARTNAGGRSGSTWRLGKRSSSRLNATLASILASGDPRQKWVPRPGRCTATCGQLLPLRRFLLQSLVRPMAVIVPGVLSQSPA